MNSFFMLFVCSAVYISSGPNLDKDIILYVVQKIKATSRLMRHTKPYASAFVFYYFALLYDFPLNYLDSVPGARNKFRITFLSQNDCVNFTSKLLLKFLTILLQTLKIYQSIKHKYFLIIFLLLN